MSGRRPNFDFDLRLGQEAERFVEQWSYAMLRGEHEVKRDAVALQTMRVYIETECLYASGWGPSGINVTTARYFDIVIGDAMIIALPTNVLRPVVAHCSDPALRMAREEKDGSHPTRGVAIPLGYLMWRVRAELIRQSVEAAA